MATDLWSLAGQFGDFMNDYGVPIGMASQAAGTLMRSRANKRVREEQARRMAENRARQTKIQAEMDAKVAQQLPKFTRESEEGSRAALAEQYEQYMTPTVATGDAGEYMTATDETSTEVKERAARELAKALEKGRTHAKNSAALSAIGGADVQKQIALGDTKRDVGRLATASQNYSSILPYQLQEAHSAGDGLNLASDLASGLGQASFLWGVTAPRRPKPQAPALGSGLRMPQNGLTLGMGGPRFTGTGSLGLRG